MLETWISGPEAGCKSFFLPGVPSLDLDVLLESFWNRPTFQHFSVRLQS